MAKVTAKTTDERFKRLISHGFFAPELPPCFISNDLARLRNSIKKHIEGPTTPSYKKYISKTSWFHFPRFNRNDRKHGVLNPISYLLISNVISKNFVKLRSKASKSSGISASPLVFDWTGTRAILRSSIDLRDDFRVDLASRREVFISADLRAFYHSIYTHAIPWAVHGKSFSKKNRGNSHYGNLLDLLCRNAQDGQTLGLPVGPDTSRIIAESIASEIDAELSSSINISRKDASRYVDDYTISSGDELSGEALIAALRRAAGKFELELNHDKSMVITTSKRHDIGWKQVALSHRPSGPAYLYADFQRFFYEISRLSKELPDNNVEKWAFQNMRVAFLRCDTETWKKIQNHLVNAYRRNSTLISLLVELLVDRQALEGDVDIESISDFLDHRLPTLALEDRTGELIWFLFLHLALRIKIKADRLERLFSLEDPFCALLIRFAKSEKLISGEIDTGFWDQSLTVEGLDGPMWLYSYEGARLGLFKNKKKSHVLDHEYFSKFLSSKVEFFSIEKALISMSSSMTRRRIDNMHMALMRAEFEDDFDIENLDVEETDDEFEENFDY